MADIPPSSSSFPKSHLPTTTSSSSYPTSQHRNSHNNSSGHIQNINHHNNNNDQALSSSDSLSTSPSTSISTATSGSSDSSNPFLSQPSNPPRFPKTSSKQPLTPFKFTRKVRPKGIQAGALPAFQPFEHPPETGMAFPDNQPGDTDKSIPIEGYPAHRWAESRIGRDQTHYPSRPDRNQRQNRPFQEPNTPKQKRTTLVMNEDWKKEPEIRVKISKLPQNTTTLDLWSFFNQYGEISEVEIYEDSQGRPDGSAIIKFRPPPKVAFWVDRSVAYNAKGRNYSLNVEVKFNRWTYKVKSPADPSRQFPEMLVVPVESLEFGFMMQERTMMSMFKTKPKTETSFQVNLKRREVDIFFTMIFNTTEGHRKRRKEKYRFRIPFVALTDVFEVESGAEERDGYHSRGILIALQHPPRFWRRAHNIPLTHDQEGRARRWTETEAWLRQTDIVENPRGLSSEPVAIRKRKPAIDIGRWTTYKFTFQLDESKAEEFNLMMRALKDFNVMPSPLLSFSIIEDHQSRVWDVIDPPAPTTEDESNLNIIRKDWDRTRLPFPLRYQLEACISQGCVSEYNMTKKFIDRLTELESGEPGAAVKLLESVVDKCKRYYDPMDIFKESRPSRSKQQIPEYCVETRKVTITPTMIYYTNPTVETSNRVVRHFIQYKEHFLRASFTDEKLHGKISATEDDSSDEVFTRIMRTLENGIVIGDHHFRFLAFGNSQLRQHGAYFFSETEQLTCDDIRKWMGQFEHINVIAKYAARLGQCFSTTRAINGFKVKETHIPDVYRNGFIFTDGCGTISQSAAQLIASEFKLPKDEPAPSVFQFRLGGCKGVLAVDPHLKKGETSYASFQVCIRPSQKKFEVEHNILEIIKCSAYAGATLNRQLIAVLSDLGIDDEIFLSKLHLQLSGLDEAMENQSAALSVLRRHIDPNEATLRIARLVIDGFMSAREPFVTCLLHLWRAWSIKMLKEKARIAIDNGCFLLGVVDETATLKGHFDDKNEELRRRIARKEGLQIDLLPQIFVQIKDHENKGRFRVIEGPCILARNPSLHPGDIRVVNAVDCAALRHLRNVVVLPQTGTRSIANMCSGGDLDGDDYIVIWDGGLLPPKVNEEPMDYQAPPPKVTTDGKVNVSDITAFFVSYIKNDTLGTIANNHLAMADRNHDGVFSPQCIELAGLHSLAVDFPKTGVSAKLRKDLRVGKRAHFFEWHPENPDKSYRSEKILGQLYDAVDKVSFRPEERAEGLQFDDRVLNAFSDIEDNLLDMAKNTKSKYDEALSRIMAQHEIKTEFEVWSTFILGHSTLHNDYKYHEEMHELSSGLIDRFEKIIRLELETQDEYTIGRFAAAMYIVTGEEYTKGMAIGKMPFISFPWIFAGLLGKIAEGEGVFTKDPVTGMCVPPSEEAATLTQFSRWSGTKATATIMEDNIQIKRGDDKRARNVREEEDRKDRRRETRKQAENIEENKGKGAEAEADIGKEKSVSWSQDVKIHTWGDTATDSGESLCISSEEEGLSE